CARFTSLTPKEELTPDTRYCPSGHSGEEGTNRDQETAADPADKHVTPERRPRGGAAATRVRAARLAEVAVLAPGLPHGGRRGRSVPSGRSALLGGRDCRSPEGDDGHGVLRRWRRGRSLRRDGRRRHRTESVRPDLASHTSGGFGRSEHR